MMESIQLSVSNYHKVLEYLSTGKPIISTRISMYDDLDLFSMQSTFDTTVFPNFFQLSIDNWFKIDTESAFKKRIKFSHDNCYQKKINSILNEINL